METTRHYTATVYVVAGGATALHEHDRLGITIPPGGHVHQDELPHEAGRREVREEIGLEPTLVRDDLGSALETETGRPLPQPRYQMLYDIDAFGGDVAHQHVDHVYFARVPSRAIDPGPDEAPAERWTWYTPTDLRASGLDTDVVRLGTEAIEAVGSSE